MGSVSIHEWRYSIGSFFGGRTRASGLRSKVVQGLRVQGSANMIIIAAMWLVYGNITKVLFVKSGVEINPGPDTNKNTGNLILFYRLLFQANG